MKLHIVNLGCKVNRVESDTIALSYMSRGAKLVSLYDAELVVVNTCTVTGEAEKKTRKTIRKVLRENTKAKVIVTGCAAVIDPDFFTSLDKRIVVVDKSELLEDASLVSLVRVGENFPTRVAIKVQDGCNHACSYCIVHTARGKAWSRSFYEIISEACALENSGVKEIVLTGIDLGSYNDNGKKLVDLCRALLEQTSSVRYRISSVEPRSLSGAMIDLLASANGRICRHLHLPLQSGSNKVLEEMYRPYKREDFLRICKELQDKIPSISLSTDIIVGFPGETEKDFEDTLSLVREIGFSKIHIFRYSKRIGTPAADRDDQIDSAIKEKRAHILAQLEHELRIGFIEKKLGSFENIVVEKTGWGMTESYYKVELDSSIPAGTVFNACLTEIDSSAIIKL